MRSITKNLLSILLGVILPAYLPYFLQDQYSTKFIINLRITTLIIIIVVGIFLFIYNFKAKKDKTSPFFVLTSVGIILYFGYTLLISLAFRNFGF